MTRTLLLATTGALLALNLGACSRSEPEPRPVDEAPTERVETPRSAEPTVEPPTFPSGDATESRNAAAQDNVATEMLPEPAPLPDEQMMDDASATGMTARASREELSSEAPVAEVDQSR